MAHTSSAEKTLEMVAFVNTHQCRRQVIANHYGEHDVACRQGCDNCRSAPTLAVASDVDACARAILSVASRATARTTPNQLIKLLSKDAACKKLGKVERERVLMALLQRRLIDTRSTQQRYNSVCHISISNRGKQVLAGFNQMNFTIVATKAPRNIGGRKRSNSKLAATANAPTRQSLLVPDDTDDDDQDDNDNSDNTTLLSLADNQHSTLSAHKRAKTQQRSIVTSTKAPNRTILDLCSQASNNNNNNDDDNDDNNDLDDVSVTSVNNVDNRILDTNNDDDDDFDDFEDFHDDNIDTNNIEDDVLTTKLIANKTTTNTNNVIAKTIQQQQQQLQQHQQPKQPNTKSQIMSSGEENRANVVRSSNTSIVKKPQINNVTLM